MFLTGDKEGSLLLSLTKYRTITGLLPDYICHSPEEEIKALTGQDNFTPINTYAGIKITPLKGVQRGFLVLLKADQYNYHIQKGGFDIVP